MRFSQEFIERVRDANNIVDIFSEYTTLKRSSSSYMGLCPLPGHNEKSPSFSVSEEKQVYHCFGCQKSGNIFKALEELKGYSFVDAVEYLAERAGIPLPAVETKGSKAEEEKKSLRDKLLKLNKFAAAYYHHNLMNLPPGHPVKAYCLKRGLTPELIKQFHIGYANEEWEGLQNYLRSVKAPPTLGAIVGLSRKRKQGDGYYDLFRHRLIFSIQNHKGEYVGFGGRALSDADQPKYLNSPESEIFQKGQTFYGLNESAPFIRQEQTAIVVEGYMDFLALFGAGIKNVVATLGTALTSAHAHLLKRYAKNVIVLFDGDEAGQRAAQRSLPILLGAGLVAKGLTLPNDLDPDDFLKEKGTKELKNLIDHAPELFQLQLDRLLLTFKGSPSEKVALLDKLGPIFENISDLRLKELYMAEVAQRISVDAQWVARNLPKSRQNAQNRPGGIQNTTITPKDRPAVLEEGPKIKLLAAPKAELFLLNIALMSREDFARVWDAEVVEKMTHPGVQEMLVAANEFYRQNPSEFDKLTAYLMTKTSTPQEIALHLGEPMRSLGAEEKEKMIADCLKQVEEKYARLKTREIAAKMRKISTADQLKELEQIVNIRKGSRKPKKTN